ncbi:hypothetical protein LQV63_17695 [Paenibacillus profundus]|uniref:Uncharacterized protein n=1 Tax=Paenibacillus profundus TaxID=1173085 RepID=A0ABS8YGN6_9BACL|nr:hypothetical protein [Paenibacillus profundus]MCE5171138.1 hypothetical protein [Paenibacillus profundus]
MPLNRWDILQQSASLAEATEEGCDFIEAYPLEKTLKLFVPEDGTLRTVVQTLMK